MGQHAVMRPVRKIYHKETMNDVVAEALVSRAQIIFDRLSDEQEVRNVLVKLLFIVQRRTADFPIHEEVRRVLDQSVQGLSHCLQNRSCNPLEMGAALRTVSMVLNYLQEKQLLKALECGFAKLHSPIKHFH